MTRGTTPLPATTPRAQLGERAGDDDELRLLLRQALGDDERTFVDPAGGRVHVTQAIVDHMIESPARQDGREAFFPFIPELLEDPAEIWAGFAVNEATGQVGLRRRYIKLLALDRDTVVALIADADKGLWSGLTFFRGRPGSVDTLRAGHLVYRK